MRISACFAGILTLESYKSWPEKLPEALLPPLDAWKARGLVDQLRKFATVDTSVEEAVCCILLSHVLFGCAPAGSEPIIGDSSDGLAAS